MTPSYAAHSPRSTAKRTEQFVWYNPSDRSEVFAFEVQYKITQEGKRYLLPRQSQQLNQLKKQYASYLLEIE
jgi:hypothetical protein